MKYTEFRLSEALTHAHIHYFFASVDLMSAAKWIEGWKARNLIHKERARRYEKAYTFSGNWTILVDSNINQAARFWRNSCQFQRRTQEIIKGLRTSFWGIAKSLKLWFCQEGALHGIKKCNLLKVWIYSQGKEIRFSSKLSPYIWSTRQEDRTRDSPLAKEKICKQR